ncbi:glycosyltransferase family 9 protein [Caldisericum exile]|uniref:glycosyltransferase family 9 protein n=1 Tax=Caldisericum exile TaxID=693075 RepID=UPI003C7691A6
MKRLVRKLIKLINEGVDILILISKKKPSQFNKNILLVRLDAIGDYILFRNFIEVLKNSEKYKGYKITLVGNIAWKEIAEFLDKNFVEEFIWVDVKKFFRNPIYRFKVLKEISKKTYKVVIHPTYSRTFDADAIVRIANAEEKIGSIGDLSNISKRLKDKSDKFYTSLIPASEGIIFEFYRNKEFFENLLEEKIFLKKPKIDLPEIKFRTKIPKNYAVIFIGASAEFRKWDINNFAVVSRWIKESLGYNIVLLGGKEDMEKVKTFKKVFGSEDFVDLVGKTTLIDVAYILKDAKMIISNETFVPHMAVALGCKNIFIIYNGNHFGRFIPYPKEIEESYYPIYHPEIEKDLENYKILSNKYGYGSRLNINDISPEEVIRKIKNILQTSTNQDKGVREICV